MGSALLTSFALLTQALAPAEASWEGEMVHLRSEVADDAEQLLKLQSITSGGVTCSENYVAPSRGKLSSETAKMARTARARKLSRDTHCSFHLEATTTVHLARKTALARPSISGGAPGQVRGGTEGRERGGGPGACDALPSAATE